VVARLALGVLAAGLVARRPAVVVVAGAVLRTLTVVDAFASGTADQRVAPVPGRTRADGPVRARPVEPGATVGAGAARARVAQVATFELATALERVAGVALGTGADRLVVGGLAGGAPAAHVRVRVLAGVAALEPDAGLVAGAVVVARALGVASCVWIAKEIRRAGTLSPVIHCVTVRILAAHSAAAGRFTSVGASVTGLRLAALAVRVALVPAPGQGVANVGGPTLTDGPVIGSNLAVRVGAARRADLAAGEPAAAGERVAGGAPRTPADRHVVLHVAVGPAAARDRARVHALVIFASSLRAAVRVFITLPLDASSVGVSLIAGPALAHRPASHVLAVGAGAAHALHTRVGLAAGAAVRAAEVAGPAAAQGPGAALRAVGVRAAHVAAGARVVPARHIRIADVLGRTLAHRRPAVVLADRVLAARVGRAGVGGAVGVRVARVAALALADGRPAGGGALGVDAARRGGARLQPAL